MVEKYVGIPLYLGLLKIARKTVHRYVGIDCTPITDEGVRVTAISSIQNLLKVAKHVLNNSSDPFV